MIPFINRELSWLSFNERVLNEAIKPETMPLDRLKFLAITASNLDEFCMVRIAYLNDSINESIPDDSGLSHMEQLEKTLERTYAFQLEQAKSLRGILKELRLHEIYFLKMNDLNESQSDYIKGYFEHEILPVITPLAIDPGRPFPFLSNLSLNTCVRMRDDSGKNVYAVIQVPSILPRFIPLPSDSGRYYLPLEELIAYYLPGICDLYDIEAYGFFRITRSADFDADEDTDNLLEEMKRTLKKRKRGRPIRLELSKNFDDKMRQFLREMLRISRRFIFELPDFLDLSAFMRVSLLKGFENLRAKSPEPMASADFPASGNIFALIREKDRLLHHPYESFDHVVDFIQTAAGDPNVLAIKQTLYRVSGKSRVISALEQAAEAGKQVTVLVELKARFDEENNIHWAKRLERAGCHVIYGLTGLKTHCKITLAVRREEDGLKRYLHLSTGNYNDVTARIYTDISLFTCNNELGSDASALFNHLTGFSEPPRYKKLIVAPESLKPFFISKFDQEIQNAKKGLPCGINIKVNSLLDFHIVQKLYECSKAGVPVKLLVRGICGLLPGVEGISENIRVRSIVGQYLEHSRIFIFENAGNKQYYLGSSDLMPRNLIRRVELVFPVEHDSLKDRLESILKLMWQDNVCAWELKNDYKYYRVEKTFPIVNSQLELFGMEL